MTGPGARPRSSLALRIALLAVAVAAITTVLAGLLAVSLTRRGDGTAARSTLAKVADAAAVEAANSSPARARLALRVLTIQSGAILRRGVISTTSPLVANSLSAQQIHQVLAGTSLSLTERVQGQQLLVEARPAAGGGLVLVQRRADAVALGERAIRRLVLALLIAAAVAAVLGLVVARFISGPLRRTAHAAHALASGRRDVVVEPKGPVEVVAVADALNQLARTLSASEARQREFLVSVSHDLRTPLTAITGYAESLADGLVGPEETRQVGAVLVSESARLGRLVADLLDLARLEGTDLRLDLVDTDLAGFVTAAGQVWARRCGDLGVEFAVQARDVSGTLRTDPVRLRQVIDGLLENALRVTPAGRPVVLAARDDTGGGVLEVRDGGPGLTDDDIAVAFTPSALYERYRGVRQVGTGFGLTIVARLVARLGGTVEAGHAVEGGARFTVWLPSDGAQPVHDPNTALAAP